MLRAAGLPTELPVLWQWTGRYFEHWPRSPPPSGRQGQVELAEIVGLCASIYNRFLKHEGLFIYQNMSFLPAQSELNDQTH